MKPIEIIAQIVSILGMLMSVLSYQQKGKARILFFQLLGSALFVVHFFMINALSGAILNFVAIVRALIFIYEDKIRADHPAWTIGLTATYVLSYVSVFTVFGKEPTAINLILEVLPVIAMTVTTIAFRSKEEKVLRRVAFISSPLCSPITQFSSPLAALSERRLISPLPLSAPFVWIEKRQKIKQKNNKYAKRDSKRYLVFLLSERIGLVGLAACDSKSEVLPL
jgi:hypothetical protein